MPYTIIDHRKRRRSDAAQLGFALLGWGMLLVVLAIIAAAFVAHAFALCVVMDWMGWITCNV